MAVTIGSIPGFLRRTLARHGILVALIVEVIVFHRLSPQFLTWENSLNVLRQNSVFAIMAAGMTFVIISGGIDLSVGSLVALVGMVVAVILTKFEGPLGILVLLAILAGLGTGLLSGLLSGLVVTQFRIPPFIITLGLLQALRGLAFKISERGIYGLTDRFTWIGKGHFLTIRWGGLEAPIPIPIWIAAAILICAYLLLHRTRFGRHVYAIGGNEEAARLSGVPVNWVRTKIFMLCGALTGLAGVVQTARLGSGVPSSGQLYELIVIASTVVGGTSLMGGKGSIGGTIIGVMVIGILNNGLNMIGVDTYTRWIVMGCVILAAVMVDPAQTKITALLQSKGWLSRDVGDHGTPSQ